MKFVKITLFPNGIQEIAGSNPVAPTIYCYKGVKIILAFYYQIVMAGE